MRIKKYLVDSLPEAMQQIKAELGQEAVIINTKNVKIGGVFGLFQKSKIEVIAGVDPVKKPKEEVSVKKHLIMKQQNEPAPVKPVVQVKQQPPSAYVQPSHDIVHEIQDMKKIMHHFLWQKKDQLPVEVQSIAQLFVEQEINEAISTKIIAKLVDTLGDEKISEQQVKYLAKAELKDLVNPYFQEPVKVFSKITCFVGPTGVGKTTTIAKLAAELMLKQNKTIGFLTTDTYRIAAVEQLKTYANILNAPFEVVYQPEDMTASLQRLANCDYILMDTAGRNYLALQYLEELKSFLPNSQTNVHLVLSASTKYVDLRKLVAQFQSLKLTSIIFTKLDETKSYGNLINVLEEFKIAFSYMTNGQNVPDDLLWATSDHLVKLIFGEEANDGSS